jgi:hypothetical protein
MTVQTEILKSLGGSPAGLRVSRLCTLTLAVIFAMGGAAAGMGQDQSGTGKSAQLAEKKPPAEPAIKKAGAYEVHQSLEVGGRYTNVYGSGAMWDTLFNQTSGGRILEQSLEMRSTNPSKTPFFDTLTTYSTGYGGDPTDVSRINMSKGRIYDFNGSFRRDRNYFDYNLLDNSLLGPTALVPENDSLHLFNTVRRNTDANFTLLPLSLVSIRIGYNHGTHEGPSFTSVHDGGDVQLAQWFRNSRDTYSAGVDWKPFKRTTISYDQFFVLYRADSTFKLAGANWQIGQFTATPPAMTGSGVYESLGVDTLSTATCGSGTSKTTEIYTGLANPYCSGTTAMTEVAPMRNKFPTEQFRFSSNYWDKVAVHARLLYSDGSGTLNNFNETFVGFNSRGDTRQVVETGGLPNNNLANTRRISVNGDVDIAAELTKRIEFTDALDYWKFRVTGSTTSSVETWAGTASSSILTPISGLTPTTAVTSASSFLTQRISGNTAMISATVTPDFKLTGGWRFRSRAIGDPHVTNETWHENSALLGAVIQPSQAFRLNINYESLASAYASGVAFNGEASGTPQLGITNTFTRIAPNKAYHIRARATIRATNWLNLAIAGNDYSAKNDDPMVNHVERNHDFSFGASIQPSEKLNVDVNYAYETVFAQTNLCYIYSATPIPFGATNSGTCVQSAANPQGASNLLLGSGTYNAPANFVSGSLSYLPSRTVKLSLGSRLSNTSGSAEQLNPYMVPGALRSTYLIPYADAVYNITPEWAWHGNFVYDEYSENGLQGTLAPRNTHGHVLTLGVKYAF